METILGDYHIYNVVLSRNLRIVLSGTSEEVWM